IVCAYLRFSPIIATLGMLSVLRGTTLLINSIEVNGLGDTYFFIGNGSFVGIPILLWVVGTVFLLAAGFLSLPVWGRYVFAIGVLDNGLTLLNVPPFVQLVASGVALIFAASLDALGTVLGPRLEQRRRVNEQLVQAEQD